MKKYRDHYFNRAKQEDYPARSVYKLQELHKRFSLLRKGAKVLDLGAAPGSWTLFAAKKVGPTGAVVAVDLQETETGFPPHVAYFQADAFEPAGDFAAALESTAPFDLVMSDMAPKTTGVKFTDQCRSMELAMQALELAQQYLIKGGHFAVKVFMGPDIQDLPAAMRPVFKTVKSFKPKSSRAESKEIFYVGLGFTGSAE